MVVEDLNGWSVVLSGWMREEGNAFLKVLEEKVAVEVRELVTVEKAFVKSKWKGNVGRVVVCEIEKEINNDIFQFVIYSQRCYYIEKIMIL